MVLNLGLYSNNRLRCLTDIRLEYRITLEKLGSEVTAALR